MSENTELKKVSADVWINKRQKDILGTLDTLRELKSITLPANPEHNLNELHASISKTRGYQEYIRASLVTAIAYELEVKRLLANSESALKDALAKAFVEKADIVALGKSVEERMIRLRPFVPEIKEKEEFEALLESVRSFKEALDLVFRDLSSCNFSISSQVNVIRSQILSGEIKIQVGDFTAKSILSENTLDAVEKAAVKNVLNGEITL